MIRRRRSVSIYFYSFTRTFIMLCMFYIFFLLIIKVHGDNNIVYPTFPRQAEFLLESIINDGQHRRMLFECIYDYDNNQLILIDEQNHEYYNYTSLKKAIYSLKHCDVYPIDRDNPFDGFSAVTNVNDKTTHIRLLEDFFLFTSKATYLGESTLRGFIHVDQWKTSIANDSDIIWSFAKSNYTMTWNTDVYPVPIQRVIKRKDDSLILQVLNIFNYRTIITKIDLTPPKGIFCPDLVRIDELRSLHDVGMIFPKRFSVRIDASTTSQQLWQSVHLRYHVANKRKLIRYDYTLDDNTLNPITIIFDISSNVSRLYQINRRTGLCSINESTEIIFMKSVLHHPIETLIKYEDLLLTDPPKQFFQYTGRSPCRGSILCEIYIGQMFEFPSDPEEDWLIANMEWGWSKQDQYDYPVYLDLNLYQDINGYPANIHYEFYDYHPEVYLNEFDVNLCYRSNRLEYQHLAFQLKIITNDLENHLINRLINIFFVFMYFFFIYRRQLIESIRERMSNLMSIEKLRISQLELDHHSNETGHNDTLYCIFTLLDRTPLADINSEIGLIDAQEKLKNGINTGIFQFHTDDGLFIEAVSGSLENIQYFYVFNPNMNQMDYFANTTVQINRTIVEKIEVIHERIRYSNKAQAVAIFGGMFMGILSGSLVVFVVIYMIKRKANMAAISTLAFRNISFRIRNNNQKQEEPATIAIEHSIDATKNVLS